MAPLWMLRPINPWLGRFLPGLLLGYALKWWLDQSLQGGEDSDEDERGSEAPSSRGGGGGSGGRGRQRQGPVPEPAEELKMVLVVNDELKMGKGKIGAQCAHAAVGAVEKLNEGGDVRALRQWEAGGQAKVCLRAPDTQELRALGAAAKAAGLPIFIVQDAGRTQVAPGSRTVLAIGPAPRSEIDKVTGHLKLL